MGKQSVSLRHQYRPRLILESFEDRRLLSGGTFSQLSFPWLGTVQTSPSLESRTVALVATPGTTTTAQAEAKKAKLEEKKLLQQLSANQTGTSTLSGKNPNQSEQTSTSDNRSRGGDGGSNQGQSSTKPIYDKINQEPVTVKDELDAELVSELQLMPANGDDESGSEEGSPGESGNHEQRPADETESGDGHGSGERPSDSLVIGGGDSGTPNLDERPVDLGESVRPPRPALESAVVDSAVSRVLTYSLADPSDRGASSSDQGLPLRADAEPVNHGSEERPNQEALVATSRPADVTPANDTTTPRTADDASTNRGPASPRVSETRAAARGEADAGNSTLGFAAARPEAPADTSRGLDRVPHGLAARSGVEAAATTRLQETSDGRPLALAAAAAFDYGATATANHKEAPTRTTQTEPGHLHAATVLVTTALTPPGTEAVLAVAEAAAQQLGILDLAVYAPHMGGLLEGIVPIDPEAMQAAMQQFLAQVENLSGDAASWLARINLSPWVVGLAIGLTAYDVARRRQQQAQRGLVLTDEDGTPLTWFPGLAGLWTMREA